jgi:putative Holliday junction resolvase
MRYLAIDYGARRTGLAICDQSETIASPYGVIQGHKNIIEKITEIVDQENVEAVVVGLPLNMDDSTGPQAKLVLEFAKQLENELSVPVLFQDERLSSFAAREKLSLAEIPAKKQKRYVDAIAAAEILQAFLEQKDSS